MWEIKKFKKIERMRAWLKAREGQIQYTELFINNGYGVEWRRLREVYPEDPI
jgi:hypothetical protein